MSYDRCLDLDPSGDSLERLYYINGVFDELSSENKNISVFDVCDAPHYVPGIRGMEFLLRMLCIIHLKPIVRLRNKS